MFFKLQTLKSYLKFQLKINKNNNVYGYNKSKNKTFHEDKEHLKMK